MYQLFTKRYISNNTIIRPPEFELIKRTYIAEVKHIVDYFNTRVYAVKSDHLLARLLTIAGIPFQYDLNRFTELANTRTPYIAKTFNFTDPTNAGRLFKGMFYGEGTTEIIISDDEYFEPHTALADWKNIQAVKVMMHPVSSLSLLLLNGKVNTSDTGLAVININIPLLLVQYRGFVEEQQLKINNGSVSLLSVQHFIHMHVLPNMLYSHIETVVLNRLMNLYYGAPNGVALKKYPFQLSNYESKVDKVLGVILKKIKNNRLPYYTTLKIIPSIFKEDCQDSLLMPDIAKTRQVIWALFMSRLKIMKFLIDVGDKPGQYANTFLIGRLQRDIKYLLNTNMLPVVLSEDLLFDTMSDIKDILAIH